MNNDKMVQLAVNTIRTLSMAWRFHPPLTVNFGRIVAKCNLSHDAAGASGRTG